PFRVSCVARARHLPSFPTRRSSDLGKWEVDELRISTHMLLLILTSTLILSSCNLNGIDPITIDRTVNNTPVNQREESASRTSPEDRKSTRLNSSHVKISYAVFCLKQ